MAYKGRQTKASHNYAFGSVEARDEYLAGIVQRETEREDYKRERRQASHGLSVGDVLYIEWGYEQTNVTYFEVLRVPSGRSVVIRELESVRTEDRPMAMTGYATPCPGRFAAMSKEQTRRATGFQTVGAGSDFRGCLKKWSGEPRRVTWYA